ncbi:MAG: EamA family transporter, partial [Acidimicrobiales bacterium]|nr:EamA family transporter [Acidimicrobiales bacterium]
LCADGVLMADTATIAAPVPTVPGGRGTVGATALTALAPLSWGTTYLVTTELLPAGHPTFAAVLRALPAGLIALALTGKLPSDSWWWKAGVLGTLNIGIFLPLLFVAAQRLPGGAAATLGAVQPVVVAALSVLVLRERWSVWRLSWGLIGAAGVGLVVLGPDAALDPVGIAAGLVGTVAMAVGVALTKLWGRPDGVGPVTLAGWQLTAGGLVMVPLALMQGVPSGIDGSAVGGYLWLGLVGGLIAYTLWFRGIGRLPVTATALLVLLSPLMAAALGATVLDESFTPVQGVGFLLALTALVAGQFQPTRRIHTAPGAVPLA